MAGKILIADDSLRIQKELSDLLTSAGVEVATVSNGEHAVRQLSTVQPDLVLADIFMPVRTGYEVCEYIKTREEFRHIGVLLLASKMEPYDEKEAARVGADGKIDKPFSDTQTVLDAVKERLDALLALRPAPPIDEFSAAVPIEEAADSTTEAPAEPDMFASGPAPVTFEDASAPLGFAEVLEESEEETPRAELVEAENEGVATTDLSHATLLTTADELKRRMAELAAPPPAPPAETPTAEEEELPPAAVVESEAEPEAAPAPPHPGLDLSQSTMLTTAEELKQRMAEMAPPPAEEEELPAAVLETEPAEEEAPAVLPEAAEEEEVADLSHATLLTTAAELQKRMAELAPQPPPPEEEEVPAAEIIPTEQPAAAVDEERAVEKPELAEAWEMTGPEPGGPEIPAMGGEGWDSQWKGMSMEEGEAAVAAEVAPAEEEAPAPAPAGFYPPAEFAAAFAGEEGAAAATAPPTEEAPAEMAEEMAAALEEPPLDPAVVDDIVNKVLERLSPQVMETIAREIVRPLAEALLREKLRS